MYQTLPTPNGAPDDEDMTYEPIKRAKPAEPTDLRPWPQQVTERIVALEAAVNRLTDEVEYLRKKQS